MKKQTSILQVSLILLVILSGCKSLDNTILVRNLRCEYLKNPKGVEQMQPFLSWEMEAPNQYNIKQKSYRIEVFKYNGIKNDSLELFWDSDFIDSDKSVNVKYNGPDLESAQKYYWQVQIIDNKGRESEFSELASFETGIINKEDWKAEWVYCPDLEPGNCPLLAYQIDIDKVPAYVPAFIASIGYHELYVNGKKVGDAVLTPSVSNLSKRVLYTSYDISANLEKGNNTIVIWLGNGWSDFYNRVSGTFKIDKKPACKAQFKIDKDWVVTNEQWRYVEGNTYHLGAWTNSNFGGDSVIVDQHTPVSLNLEQAINVDTFETDILVSSDFIEPNRLVKKRKAVAINKTNENTYQFKMDSIYTGWIEVELKGKPGQTISILSSSYADKEVEFNQRNTITLGKEGEGTFKNRFSYHQVEYVTVKGIDYKPELNDIIGYQVTNDRQIYGDFECSNSLINKIYDITCYTYESLSTGGMTVDCPHRERLGYGGDGHGSLEIAMDAFASYSFLSKWAQDWVDIQDPNGRINHTAPTLGGGGGPAWSGFVLALPWEHYKSYGDIRIIQKTFPAAKRWLSYLKNYIGENGLLDDVEPGKWKYPHGKKWIFLGDWATPYGNEHSDTPEALLFNNCYYVYVLNIAIEMATLLNDDESVKEYNATKQSLIDAINNKFYNADSTIYIDSKQPHLILPLYAGVVPKEDIPLVEKNLEHEIVVNQTGHFATGIHGTWFLTKYLFEKNRNDLLYLLTSQTTFPSYGEMISRGEITWPEHWYPVNSRAHGCLNGIGGWFQRGILGIQPDPKTPGYKHIIIKPAYIDSLQWAKGYHISPYGRIDVSWKKRDNSYELDVDIPVNTAATIYFPQKEGTEILVNKKSIQDNPDINILGDDNELKLFQVGSGKYTFR